MPEELGPGRESGRTAGETTDGELGLGTRADGAGEPEPVIVRWFDTWARGEDGPALTGR